MQRSFTTQVCPLVLALFTSLAATHAMAVDPVEHQVQLIATVPADTFYVVPSDTGWIGTKQQMEWQQSGSTGDLKALDKDFDVKHTAGSINAHLTDGSAYLFNGTDQVDLKVTFAGTELNETSQPVVSEDDAKAGKRVKLNIKAVKPTGAEYKPGSYSGIVNMTFDAIVSVI